jgi:molybdate transport system substrate-binding protein
MRFRAFAIVLLLTTAVRAADVSVAAAISLKESLETIRTEYQKASPDRVKLTFGSSGQMAAQIQNGAPIDLFISAARKQVDDLEMSGKAEDAAVVARNELVLIVPVGAKGSIAGFNDLTKAKKIAVGEPMTVPAGEYAVQTLEHLKLDDALKSRLVYGLNVRQVLQYVQSGEVDAGIVYLTDAREAGEKVKIVAKADPDWHQPIEYVGAVVTGSANADAAKKFLQYLQADSAQQILEARGFARPQSNPTTSPAK